ncbi:MAG: carboxypeptidase, partial [Chloroflexi bacterium]|nr:carboxypeptidase [Chloroflexota bacterium]
RWLEANGGEDAIIDWYPYAHPQLGPLELGGLNGMYTWRNPPHALMGEEAEKNTPYTLALADMLPRLTLHELSATPLGDGRYRLRLVVENSGFLSTQTSGQGQKRNAARPVRVELSLPEGAALVTGKARTELGHLQGRSNKLAVTALRASSPTDNRAWSEWVVQGKTGDEIGVTVLSDRAGTIRRFAVLGAGE